ncbi:uncharacterized protein BDZ99DRAFT_465625 [Mytilinidion resinicola]|uniref:Uncharacterized protein n=1 Tax=Mytilinidion resinicola TaxID=574789 RepID=A0A6A6YFP2_9PEZI|nr:uncharacterized protein BDZ99DRAFT_465625 [Mytilinidion resinicola]KAF2806865.1 hypothetical protein BDZ99DRAFT_465625 [Mytilinidion resinicola]
MNFPRSMLTPTPTVPAPIEAPVLPWNPTPSDTILVRSYLVHLKLPTELALTIIDYAQYYPIVHSRRDEELKVIASNYKGNSAAALCVVSEPIPAIQDGERIKRKTVKFRLRSHDQGWGGDPGCPGTYNGSYTWFEASILRPSGSAEVTPIPLNLFISPRPTSSSLDRYHVSLVAPPNAPDDPVWHIQRNMCASPQERTHEVEWREGSAFDPSLGSGDGKGFCETLQPGDRIAIWARALYPGWLNCVKEASMEVLLEID